MGLKQINNNNTETHYIYPHHEYPANLHKLSVFSQILNELRAHSLAEQNRAIKSAGEEDLRYMPFNRYLLRFNQMPDTMTALMRDVEELLPDIKRIIEK